MNTLESGIPTDEIGVEKTIYDASAVSIPDATLFHDLTGLSIWKNNFDRIICNPQFGFFGAIDGAGRTPETWDAVRVVRREFQKSLKNYHLNSSQPTIDGSQKALYMGYISAREYLREYLENVPEEDKERLKNFTVETTATVIDFVSFEVFNIFHIGDSRLYIFNKNKQQLTQLTPDQSYLDQQENNSIISPAQNRRIQSIMDNLQFEDELGYLVLPDGKVVKEYNHNQYKQLLEMRAFPVRYAWENKRFLSSSINIVGKEKSVTKTYHIEPNDLGYLIMSDGIYENIRQDEMYNEASQFTNPEVSTDDIKNRILNKSIGYARNPIAVKRLPDDMSLIVGRFRKTN